MSPAGSVDVKCNDDDDDDDDVLLAPLTLSSYAAIFSSLLYKPLWYQSVHR
jgi:hypothetical protein